MHITATIPIIWAELLPEALQILPSCLPGRLPDLIPTQHRNPQIFICSASTPPIGGVHGMCGYYAAKSVLKKMGTKGKD